MTKKEEIQPLIDDLVDLSIKINTEAEWMNEMLNEVTISPPNRVLKVIEREALDVVHLCRKLQGLIGDE